jgi:hypothetical protein
MWSIKILGTENCRRGQMTNTRALREELDSPTKRHLRKKAVHIVKHAGGKTAHNLQSMFSRKGSDKSKEECQNDEEDDDRSATKIDAVVAPIPSSAAVDAAEPVADGDDKISAK